MSMYKRILVPVDGSPTSNRGLEEAIELARLTGAALRLVHVVDQLVFVSGAELHAADVMGRLRETGERILAAAKARVEAAGLEATTFLCDTFGVRVSELVSEQARQWNADLIVLGSHGRRGTDRLFMGSDAEQVMRTAPTPVLVVRAAPPLVALPSRQEPVAAEREPATVGA
jgi:nucleotide-binding universal stress UspA family protein